MEMKFLSLSALAILSCRASPGYPLVPFQGLGQADGTTPRRLDYNGYGDHSWMKGYTLRYNNCFPHSGLVSFLLCPEGDSCKHGVNGDHIHEKCDDGSALEYLVDFYYFLDVFTEAQMGAREYACEMVREKCGDNYENCYTNYYGYDYSYCNNDNEFDLQEFLECKEIGEGYYVGPYCSTEDSFSIYLGVFTDQYCRYPASDNSAYYEATGSALPYTGKSIIQNNCARCKEHGEQQDQNYYDQQDNDDVLEQCEDLYEAASKCEADQAGASYVDTSGCSQIEALVQADAVLQEESEALVDVVGLSAFLASKATAKGIFALAAAAIAACMVFACCRRDRIDNEALVEVIRADSDVH